jgi:hypothetical protein
MMRLVLLFIQGLFEKSQQVNMGRYMQIWIFRTHRMYMLLGLEKLRSLWIFWPNLINFESLPTHNGLS